MFPNDFNGNNICTEFSSYRITFCYISGGSRLGLTGNCQGPTDPRGPETADKLLEKEYLRNKINCLVSDNRKIKSSKLLCPRGAQFAKQSGVSGTLNPPLCYMFHFVNCFLVYVSKWRCTVLICMCQKPKYFGIRYWETENAFFLHFVIIIY